MKHQFLSMYDELVDEVYLFFFEQTQNKNTSKNLTEQAFIKTWQHLTQGTKLTLLHR